MTPQDKWKVYLMYTAGNARYFVSKSPDYTKAYKGVMYKDMKDAESLCEGLNAQGTETVEKGG